MNSKTDYTMPSPKTATNFLSVENPVFCCFLFWSSVLVVKMLLMSAITGLQRIFFMVYINPEDLIFKDVEIKYNNPRIERARRAHRNDLENILPYFTMALLYICTDPNPSIACNLFRIGSIARIIHTLVYAFRPVPQPSRFIAFFITYLITLYMAFDVGVQMLKHI
uniref:Microsomal glutathione S-transferase 1 n=1 Tax=Glossina austeni TaxID=7395 RepID=A0A1A9VLG5_GLOAU